MCNHILTTDQLLKILKKDEEDNLKLPLCKRIFLAAHVFRLNWILRKFYKSGWWISSIADGWKLIFKIRK